MASFGDGAVRTAPTPAAQTPGAAAGRGRPVRIAARPDAPGGGPQSSAPVPPATYPAGLDATLESFLVTIVRLAGARAGAVRAQTPGGDRLRLVASWGLPAEVVEREALIDPCGVCGEAMRDDLVHVAAAGERCGLLAVDPLADAPGTGRGTVAVPLEYKGRTVGVFTLFFDEVNSLRAEVIHLLRPIGQLLGLTLENAKLEQDKLEASLARQRQSMAAEIHDSLAQSLTFVRMRMPLLQDAIARHDEGRAGRYCEDVSEELGSANRRLRELITHFRAGMDVHGLHRALEHAVAGFHERTGIWLDFESHAPDLRLDAEREVQVFRIVQEALANVRKHSGARHVRLRLEAQDGEVRVTVEDDGTGLPPEAGRGGFGMEIMRERADALGGRVAIERIEGGGTRVHLALPVCAPAGSVADGGCR